MDAGRFEAWQAVAARLGLVPDARAPGLWTAPLDAAGTGEIALEIVTSERGEPGQVGLRVAVAHPALAGWIMAPRAHALTLTGRRLTGDASFDYAVRLVAPDLRVHALLDLETRLRLTELVLVRGLVVGGGAIRLAPTATAALPAAQVRDTVDAMVGLARRAAALTPEAVVAAIVKILDDDPTPEVRARCAELAAESPELGVIVAERYVGLAAANEPSLSRLLATLADGKLSPEARLAALVRLAPQATPGRASIDDLRTLASLLGAWLPGGASGDRARERDALSALGALLYIDLPPEELLSRIPAAGRAVALRSSPALVRPGMRGNLFAALLPETQRDPYLAPAYLDALGTIGEGRWAPLAVSALESQYENVPEAAIRALGLMGDLTVVPALMPFTEGFFRSGRMKELARTAIASIRERHNVRSRPGALSLAGDEAGGLTLDTGDGRAPER